MTEEFVKTGNGFVLYDANNKIIAEINYAPYGEDKVIANHTFVDPSLRGHGIAEKLLDRLVEEMKEQDKKIVPHCSYVVSMFRRKNEKYKDIYSKH